MSFVLSNVAMYQESNPEKIKLAEIQFEAMNTTFNTMLRTCRNKCIADEYGESELTKGESVCVDRCVSKYFKANVQIGTYVQTQGFAPEAMRQYDQFTKK